MYKVTIKKGTRHMVGTYKTLSKAIAALWYARSRGYKVTMVKYA